jgi:glycyl-tRNA synthetase
MEIEYFIKPENWQESFESFRKEVLEYINDIGISADKVHELEVADGDRAHYSKRTIDFEFDYPFGRKELYGLAYRTDFDLSAHAKASGAELSYFDEETKTRYTPHVIEPSFGLDRTMLAVLTDAFREDNMDGETRTYLALTPRIAPVKVAVFPLLKNKPEITSKAQEIYKNLKKEFGAVMYDETGSVGKRYRKQDEIGTPYCVTVDFDTLGENPELINTVTVRDRDSGKQERMQIAKLAVYLKEKIG